MCIQEIAVNPCGETRFPVYTEIVRSVPGSIRITRLMSTSSSTVAPGRSTACDGSSTVTSLPLSRNCACVRVPVGRTRSINARIELDVLAQSTPLWATYDTYGRKFISDDQFQRYFRFKSIEDADGRLAFGSDFPASGLGTLGLSPLLQIELGHTRQYPGDPDSPLQPRESERLSVASLVRGFTLGAAYQLHMEDEIGSIEIGKKADLVVLDQNIFEIDPFTIHKTAVAMTMLNGTIVYTEDN
jgi:predicted amidohydrolase YtcJ